MPYKDGLSDQLFAVDHEKQVLFFCGALKKGRWKGMASWWYREKLVDLIRIYDGAMFDLFVFGYLNVFLHEEKGEY